MESLSQEEFAQRQAARDRQLMETHLPTIKRMVKEGLSINAIAEKMTKDGFAGLNSNRVDAKTVNYVLNLELINGTLGDNSLGVFSPGG